MGPGAEESRPPIRPAAAVSRVPAAVGTSAEQCQSTQNCRRQLLLLIFLFPGEETISKQLNKFPRFPQPERRRESKDSSLAIGRGPLPSAPLRHAALEESVTW